VPNVVGQKLARAKARIRARHCRVGTITRKRSSTAKKGRVLSQSPKGGRVLRNGAKVNLRVGKGPR
jgi:serine/threonine-protein kinase